jgi:hypothetical protein
MFKGVMYIFGGFDGMKRNDIYRILFDEDEKKKNLAEYEMRSFARSFSLINSSMDEAHDGSLDQNSQNGAADMIGENLVQPSLIPVSMSSTNNKLFEKKHVFTSEYFMSL